MTDKHSIPDLSGKTALVTGASRGIGRAMALSLAKAGAHIIAVARTTGGLEELDDEIRAIGGAASLVPLDLAEGDGIEQMAAALANRFDKIDILIANAAVLGEMAPLPDIDPKVWQKTLDINVTVNWRLVRAFDPFLRAADAARVVFLTSRVGGELARAYWGAYGVSKAALEMLAKTYAEEMRNTAVRVSIIDPGPKRTGMRREAMPGEDPMTLEPADVLTPLFYYAVSPDYDGIAERVVYREWQAAGKV